jgi:hypothetical protein
MLNQRPKNAADELQFEWNPKEARLDNVPKEQREAIAKAVRAHAEEGRSIRGLIPDRRSEVLARLWQVCQGRAEPVLVEELQKAGIDPKAFYRDLNRWVAERDHKQRDNMFKNFRSSYEKIIKLSFENSGINVREMRTPILKGRTPPENFEVEWVGPLILTSMGG